MTTPRGRRKPGVDISPKHNAPRALVASLTAAAIALPSALVDHQRSSNPGDAGPHVHHYGDPHTGGVRAPIRLAPDARVAATPVAPATDPRARDGPTVVQITPAQGFDWTSAGIGAAGGSALVVIVLAGVATVTSRSRSAPH
jgi:hypothetical protein